MQNPKKILIKKMYKYILKIATLIVRLTPHKGLIFQIARKYNCGGTDNGNENF